QPVFVRILPAIETTGTFKYRKIDLVADGFDPAAIKGAVYYKEGAKGYVKLTKPGFAKIMAGGVKL
ncbi:MAG: long-chain-acyl-CoA synthetase, partial [Phenylobacterium sp.]|nr:long-chain-acyl-CoA synthetase [Phenylobacterium sp.]